MRGRCRLQQGVLEHSQDKRDRDQAIRQGSGGVGISGLSQGAVIACKRGGSRGGVREWGRPEKGGSALSLFGCRLGLSSLHAYTG